jgi:nicotinamidase-related amidase
MKIPLPTTNRRTALLVIDVQPEMLVPSVHALIPHMVSFIKQTSYAFYAEATWFADEQSTFYLQTGDLFIAEDVGPTAEPIVEALSEKEAPCISLNKRTRSAFQAIGDVSLKDELNEHRIEEVHLFGVDINDCVFATAIDAADAGFCTFVIEELSHHSEGDKELREAALTLLRRQRMTNHSLLPGVQTSTLGIFP